MPTIKLKPMVLRVAAVFTTLLCIFILQSRLYQVAQDIVIERRTEMYKIQANSLTAYYDALLQADIASIEQLLHSLEIQSEASAIERLASFVRNMKFNHSFIDDLQLAVVMPGSGKVSRVEDSDTHAANIFYFNSADYKSIAFDLYGRKQNALVSQWNNGKSQVFLPLHNRYPAANNKIFLRIRLDMEANQIRANQPELPEWLSVSLELLADDSVGSFNNAHNLPGATGEQHKLVNPYALVDMNNVVILNKLKRSLFSQQLAVRFSAEPAYFMFPQQIYQLIRQRGLLAALVFSFLVYVLVGRSQDIQRTIRSRTRELAKSNDKLNDLMNKVSGMLYEYDMESHRFTHVSRKSMDIWGYTPEEAMNVDGPFRKHVLPADYSAVSVRYDEAFLNNSTVNVEYRVKGLKTATTWIRDIATPYIDTDGRRCIAGVMLDISEFKKISAEKAATEKMLRLRQAHFEAVTQGTNDPIILVDSIHAIMFFNRAAENAFGYQEKDVIGKPVTMLLTDDSASTFQLRTRSNYKESTAAGSYEVEGVHSDGTIILFATSLSPVALDDEQQYLVVIMHNLTQFKRMEEDLQQAQKLEAIGQLSAGIAHELNTPAQFISDNITFLQEASAELLALCNKASALGRSSTNLEELVKTIEDESRAADLDYLNEEIPKALSQSADGISRVATIVRAMKDYAHPGKEKSPIDLNHALASTITVSGSEWKYSAKMETNFAQDLPMVECVAGEINQVVLNLIVNAAHAIVDKYDDSDELDGKITISTQMQADSVLILIADNGPGIPKAIQSRMFEPFYTTKEVGTGTGQGLSIAHKIVVDKHNGKILVDSTEGVGTTFTIQLPINDENYDDAAMTVNLL